MTPPFASLTALLSATLAIDRLSGVRPWLCLPFGTQNVAWFINATINGVEQTRHFPQRPPKTLSPDERPRVARTAPLTEHSSPRCSWSRFLFVSPTPVVSKDLDLGVLHCRHTQHLIGMWNLGQVARGPWHLYTRPFYPVGNLFGFSCSVFPLQKIHHSCLCRTNCISCVYN